MLILKNALTTGLGFGLTSAVITTLGLLIGLHSSTHSRLVVLGGILTIAVADAFSDALGIHIAEEGKGSTTRQVWLASFFTFSAKLIFALTFALPVLFFAYDSAIIIDLVWGAFILAAMSYFLAKINGENFIRVAAEHLLIAAAVIVIAHYLGDWLAKNFDNR